MLRMSPAEEGPRLRVFNLHPVSARWISWYDVEQLQCIIKIDFLGQEIDEGSHPRWQPPAVAHIDDVDLLDIAGIVRLQDRNKSSCVDVGSDVEQRQSRDTLTGQSQAARNLAIARNNIAASRKRHVGS